MQMRREQSSFAVGRGAENDRGCCVAKDHPDLTPPGCQIQTGRMDLSTHNQHVLPAPAFQPRVRRGQRVHKPGALIAYVQRGDCGRPQLCGHHTRRRGPLQIGRKRRIDQKIDILDGESRGRQGSLCCQLSQIRAGTRLRDMAPLTNPCTLLDPLM